jgi:hypothetical protein
VIDRWGDGAPILLDELATLLKSSWPGRRSTTCDEDACAASRRIWGCIGDPTAIWGPRRIRSLRRDVTPPSATRADRVDAVRVRRGGCVLGILDPKRNESITRNQRALHRKFRPIAIAAEVIASNHNTRVRTQASRGKKPKGPPGSAHCVTHSSQHPQPTSEQTQNRSAPSLNPQRVTGATDSYRRTACVKALPTRLSSLRAEYVLGLGRSPAPVFGNDA